MLRALIVAGFILMLAPPAAEAACTTYPPTPSQAGEIVCSYAYTGTPQTYTVPTTMTGTVRIAASGAGGGNLQGYLTDGGAIVGGIGGQESGTFSLPAGDALTVVVGGCAADCSAANEGDPVIPDPTGGYGGGGNGGENSAGGGGGSFVFDSSGSLLIAAGGGGGAGLGSCCDLGSQGGAGSGALAAHAGKAGGDTCSDPGTDGGGGGGGATEADFGAGGAGGTNNSGAQPGGDDGDGPADSGSELGIGGGGSSTGGGGGGGGYFGGGGGGGGCGSGGGGGGSGYISPQATAVSGTTGGGDNLNGIVTVTFIESSKAPLVVNSTADTDDPPASLTADTCDTTPSAATPTCTLRAAIELVDQRGGGTISFDVPTGHGNAFDGTFPLLEPRSDLPAVTAPVLIDGTSQPSAGKIELTAISDGAGVSHGLELTSGAGGSTIEGMVINRFYSGILDVSASDVHIQDNLLGTTPSGTVAAPETENSVPNITPAAISLAGTSTGIKIGGTTPGSGNLISGNATCGIWTDFEVTDVVIEGNTIGPPTGGKDLLLPAYLHGGAAEAVEAQYMAMCAEPGAASDDQIGGSTADAGNRFSGIVYLPARSTFAGNTVQDGVVRGDTFGDTIGGATASPGTPPGNTLTDAQIELTNNPVDLKTNDNDVQGNLLDGDPIEFDTTTLKLQPLAGTLIRIQDSSGDTVGGLTADLGNLIENASGPPGGGLEPLTAGVAIFGSDSDDNVVESNTFRDDKGDGAVDVASGLPDRLLGVPAGETIVDNQMTGNTFGIDLNDGSYVYNSADASTLNKDAPNNLQPYPDLTAGEAFAGRTRVSLMLESPAGDYRIHVYEQPSCAKDSLTPGQGLKLLGEDTATPGGIVPHSFLVAPAAGAITATATSPNGSTSEFSPCLTIGHHAATFAKSGVSFPNPTASGGSAGAAADLASAAAKHSSRLTATLHPFCPPVTARYCAGTIQLRTGHTKVATLKLKLAPDALGTLTFKLSAGLSKQLERVGHIALIATTRVRDGAKPAHHEQKTVHLKLVLA